jgi:hypothetical protein
VRRTVEWGQPQPAPEPDRRDTEPVDWHVVIRAAVDVALAEERRFNREVLADVVAEIRVPQSSHSLLGMRRRISPVRARSAGTLMRKYSYPPDAHVTIHELLAQRRAGGWGLNGLDGAQINSKKQPHAKYLIGTEALRIERLAPFVWIECGW